MTTGVRNELGRRVRKRRLGLSLVMWLGFLCLAAGGCGERPAGGGAAAAGSRLESEPTALDPPSGPGAFAPRLEAGPAGPMLTWLEPGAGGHTLKVAELAGGAWADPRIIAISDEMFANWADLPAVVSGNGERFAHWLERSGEGAYAYGVTLVVEERPGEPWRRLGWLHDDNTADEHGFVSYAVSAESGAVQAFWLDGRSLPAGGDMQLRTAALGPDGPESERILDARVCECCSTDAAVTSSGPIVAYRDRSSFEVRDVAVIRATAEGWSRPVSVHDDGWEFHGCPVNGPAIDAAGERVAVAWFSAADETPVVRVAFSSDGGASFGEPSVVDDELPLGRVDLVLEESGEAVVSWLGSVEGGAEIRYRRFADDGPAGPVRSVALTTVRRSAGVPQMAAVDGGLVLVWVEDVEPSRLRGLVVR